MPGFRFKIKKNGSVLILALWSLSLLTVFAVVLTGQVRQKILLLSRLEARDKLNGITQSGIKKAIAILNRERERGGNQFTAGIKAVRFYSPLDFKDIRLNDGTCEVSYPAYDTGEITFSRAGVASEKKYGIMDEESKINLNKAELPVIKRLLKIVLGGGNEDADRLALSLLDWRQPGQSELTGFYSDEYYANLPDPYPVKNSNFENLDEILLVEGMSEERLEKLTSYLTIYGEGKVNVNTASRNVFLALGMSEALADKIIQAREGPDQIEGTDDDVIFLNPAQLASDLKADRALSPQEESELNGLSGKLDTNSQYYMIKSQGRLDNRLAAQTITCIYNAQDKKIESWKEDH